MKNKQLHIRLSEDEHKLLHIICIQKGISVQELTHNMVKDFIEKNRSSLASYVNEADEK